MGFFAPPDPRRFENTGRNRLAVAGRALGRIALALLIALVTMVGAYVANVELGLHEAAATQGDASLPGLYAPVTIVRDRRDIPHIRAANEHDLYFAEGYVEGSDRLFQLDLSRRYAYGRLAEVLGPKALALDKVQRAVDIDGIAERQLRALAPPDREAIVAFSKGVNAAAAIQPLPVEFRMLLYRPAPWSAKDSLAVSVLASLELADSWHSVFARDLVWRERGPRCFDTLLPLSDARYDVTIDGGHARQRARVLKQNCAEWVMAAGPQHNPIGSNAWAAGALRSVDGHALVANDPHVELSIPGIWYLVDVASPGMHAAGATIPGIPGVILGHNERLAWASTNAEMATTSVFEAGRLHKASWVLERFRVRFSRDATAAYYRTSRDFSVNNDNDYAAIALVRWPIYAQVRSTIATVLALDRARDVSDALRILSNYRGSPQNFILADSSGRIAYHTAGLVPGDPAWGRYVHRARDLRKSYAPVAFTQFPAKAPARDAILVSANNKPYGSDYPYRLAAQFEPPYRAYRIAELLHSRAGYDAAYFARMQLDTLSPIDLEIARDVVELTRAHSAEEAGTQALALLKRWDGRFAPDSQAAALEHALRLTLTEEVPAFGAQLGELRERFGARARDIALDVRGALPFAFYDLRAWRDAGGVPIEHPLAPLNFAFLNGGWLPGAGDEDTIHLQEPGFAQGFRAVWDVGDWDRGGITIPSGESGEPSSEHYTDLTRAWIDGRLEPLPFTRAAIRQEAGDTLVLRPSR